MKIIIAVDGSEQSFDALRMVGNLPVLHEECILVNVAGCVDLDSLYAEEDGKISNTAVSKELDEYRSEVTSEAASILNEGKGYLEKLGIQASTKIVNTVLEGSVSKSICAVAEEEKADLIVAGSRGLNPVKTFFLGSVSDGIIREGKCAVLLHRPEADNVGGLPFEKESTRIVIGFDDSDSSCRACEYIKKFNLDKISQIDLVMAIQMNYYYGMSYAVSTLDMWPEYKKTSEEAMIAMGESLVPHNESKVHYEIVPNTPDVATELNNYVNKKGIDMIVVGRKGKNLIDRFLVGSVSGRLVHMKGKPLLIIP